MTKRERDFVVKSGAVIEERDGLAMVQVSTWTDSCDATCATIAEVIGLRPSGHNGSVAVDNQIRILWLGPARWLIVMPRQPNRDLAAELAARLPIATAAVVELSAGRRIFVVSGARARDLLSKMLPIDLHPSQFPPGRCVQSSMAHVGVLVHATEKESFELFVYRGFARYFREVLEDAALEFGETEAEPSRH